MFRRFNKMGSARLHFQDLALVVLVMTQLWIHSVQGGYSSCNYGENCRRTLLVSNGHGEEQGQSQVVLQDLEYHCASVEYELMLIVDDHVSLLAIPKLNGVDKSIVKDVCGTLYLHDHGNERGKVMELQDEKDTKAELKELESDPLTLGTFVFPEILQGYYDATDTTAISDGYDLIENNCASFVLSIMHALDIQMTPEIISHAFKGLAASGKTVEALRAHPRFKDYFPTSSEKDDGFLLVEFVMFYINGHGFNMED